MAQDIFDRLKEDHEKHRALIDQIKQTTGDSEDRRRLFTQFKNDAMGHAAAEEETLYASMLKKSEIRQDANHSVSEHADLGMMFVELDEIDMGSSGWLNKFNHLAEEYIHHIDEEEEEKFPKAKEELDAAKAKALADEFDKRKPEEVERASEGADLEEIKHMIKEEGGDK
ncbi:hemerythrin domain-containing protein [Sphingomicrobium nitratireducens]|uniref:hemerythrin domain-containing protein n=1 Tax=Sphingomicrobium nitratireducens TaxID=2964666 RepID=UPI00224069FE|nr:hemerythrin domain-containing protein [Sphingomicrobium nitratireducens]